MIILPEFTGSMYTLRIQVSFENAGPVDSDRTGRPEAGADYVGTGGIVMFVTGTG